MQNRIILGKTIRSTYPKEISIGVLILVFFIAYALSHQIFTVPFTALKQNTEVYFGMFLVSMAVIIMVLILWEEILFPIKLKEIEGGVLFRNHRQKIQVQALIYLCIPAIFAFIYLEYEVNHVRFFIWAAICMVPPVLSKIGSGINNYNDFLALTDYTIEYKNNEKEGCIKLVDIRHITVLREEGGTIKSLDLAFTDQTNLVIDLDEMELEDFIDAIDEFISKHYPHLLKEE